MRYWAPSVPTQSWARRSCCTAARLSGVFLGELPRLSVDLDLAGSSPHFLRNDLARALVIRAISASHAFPSVGHPTDALDRFSTPAPDLADPLYAMLAIDDRPGFAEMIAAVTALLEPLRDPSADEAEYVRLPEHDSEYRPELLFRRWPAVLERARLDPAMRWKVMNLRRRTP